MQSTSHKLKFFYVSNHKYKTTEDSRLSPPPQIHLQKQPTTASVAQSAVSSPMNVYTAGAL